MLMARNFLKHSNHRVPSISRASKPRLHAGRFKVWISVLHRAIGGDDDAAAQFVALMDQGLQQGAGIVGG